MLAAVTWIQLQRHGFETCYCISRTLLSLMNVDLKYTLQLSHNRQGNGTQDISATTPSPIHFQPIMKYRAFRHATKIIVTRNVDSCVKNPSPISPNPSKPEYVSIYVIIV